MSDRARFCLRCQEVLPFEGEPRCPRCGLPFDAANPDTYRPRPVFLRWKYWLPGFCLAVAVGVGSYAAILANENMGIALFVSIPLCVGAILGFGTQVGIWFKALLAFLAVGSIGTGLISLNLSGLFCGLVGALVLVGPALVGMVLGFFLRQALKVSRWDHRAYLPLITLSVAPLLADIVERRFVRPPPTASITTRASFGASPRAAWESILFYEEVEHEPPLLLRLLLPRPVRSEGRKDAEGNVVRCIYEKGRLVKRITHLEEGRCLAFEVLEQKLHFERDVTLLDGSFEVETPAAAAEWIPGGARAGVALTTRYRPRLRPRFVWEPIERAVLHALHEHVLEGMRLRAEGNGLAARVGGASEVPGGAGGVGAAR